MSKIQDKELLKSFLNRTFFKDFSSPPILETENNVKLFDRMELQINSKCNLDCKYCYYNQYSGYGKQLNPNSIAKNDNIINNADALFAYMKDNNYYPEKIDIFSGEALHQKITFTILDKLLKLYENTDKRLVVVVPSNMSFLRKQSLIDRVIEYKNKFYNSGGYLGLSASVDGKFMDTINRPLVGVTDQTKYYTDDFYHKLFTFANKVGCGFHPMVYHQNIDKWIDNFEWFQENFKKYNIPWHSIYLLEVRNNGWNKDSIKNYTKFYRYVLDFVLNKFDNESFIKSFVFNGVDGFQNINNMNLFNNIGTIGRGLGCSLQTTLHIRLGDLTVNSCHRLSYEALNGFRFVKDDNNKIIDVDPLNFPFYLSTISTEHKAWPYCSNCLIKHTCMSGCLGAQFENMDDPFTPIPSVCLLEFGKVKTQIEFFKENNMFEDFLYYLNDKQEMTFRQFDKLYEETKKSE